MAFQAFTCFAMVAGLLILSFKAQAAPTKLASLAISKEASGFGGRDIMREP